MSLFSFLDLPTYPASLQMIQATSTRVIQGPKDEVWDLLSDVTTIVDYHPQVESVDLISSNKTGLGATRVCNFYDGTSIKETVSEFDDKHMLLELSDFSVPMKVFQAEFVAKSLGTNKTEISFILHYQVKYGPVGHLLGVTLVKMKMKALIKQVLASLDERVQTGQPVKKKARVAKQ